VSVPEFAAWAEETAALDRVLAGLSDEAWRRVTGFKGWSVFDTVHHLALSDSLAAAAASDAEAFRARRGALGGAAGGLGRDGPPAIAPQALLARWREGVQALRAAFEALQPSQRLPWYGPDMSARAFLVARLMETWAHGGTICEALGVVQAPTDRLKPICELGVRTHGWSFRVRGREPPAAEVSLALTAPSGEVWRWGPQVAADRISGVAEDFALVVTQRRNVADTGLVVEGEAAKAWMAIAQCFAGAASDPPAPGTRGPRPAP
jgi:uncharacterized protein (TIGR03084 family)